MVFLQLDCQNDDFKCINSGTCIRTTKKCDGNNDCPDGSDETGCSSEGKLLFLTFYFVISLRLNKR